MRKKTVRDIDVEGRRVLVRVDYNVPLDPESGRVLDDTRIKATLPTIEYLRDRHAKLILCAHLGRPKGKREVSLSLWPAAERLSELLGSPVKTTGCCCGPVVQETAHSLEAGEVLLLENVRFHAEEQENDAEYAKANGAEGMFFNTMFLQAFVGDTINEENHINKALGIIFSFPDGSGEKLFESV